MALDLNATCDSINESFQQLMFDDPLKTLNLDPDLFTPLQFHWNFRAVLIISELLDDAFLIFILVLYSECNENENTKGLGPARS